ncbi:MAG: NADPH-dependent FMN reductase [Parahaliea sp.]
MKIGIISGSHRPKSESRRVAGHIANKLQTEKLCDDTWIYDVSDDPLPHWDEGVWDPDNKAWRNRLDPISKELHSCDAFIVISPEWHGMVPALLKNFFLMWSAGGELAHKPALIVSVSASIGGAYPIAELRMSSYKNSRICYLPEHLIVRNVKKLSNEENPQDNDDAAMEYYEARLQYCLELLREYTAAFELIRRSGKASLEHYPTGM